MNLFGKGEQGRFIHAIQMTLREAFAYTKVYLLSTDGASDVKNMILIDRDKPIDYSVRQIAGFKERILWSKGKMN
ncbi:hypothetical protein [Paenibacillus sp. N3.4]|uniref:hypothetical protein n=1 Tax=Paenibacillus sp. N3.4 TaxID=2603222 RepID=UPI0011CC1A38|nr:hypothetical protein [Paenibacillus sp. N3.4]TXK84271.1 hypothetical protein FU659_09460 [Paenibacillus sp. N3.4]